MDSPRNLARVKKRKRISKKPKSCPNPLFEKWLVELRDDAMRKDSSSHLVFVYSRALKSLRKYPLPLQSGKECKILQNFGEGLCKIIDKKLEKHLSQGGSLSAEEVPTIRDPESNDEADKPPSRKGNKDKEYIPGRRTGAYAILLALLRSQCDYMTKKDLQEAAQPLCDTSLVRAAPNSRYSGWSCVSQLVEKDLLSKSGCPARFKLTEKGKLLASRLEHAESEMVTVHATDSGWKQTPVTAFRQDHVPHVDEMSIHDSPSGPASSPVQVFNPVAEVVNTVDVDTFEPSESRISLNPGEYEIVLCVDTAEVSGGTGTNNQKGGAAKAFQNCGVPYQVCKLAVGDYLWICKPKAGSSLTQDTELVLPFIVERKRLDDLASSIKDGRFKEQKFRLKNCGLSRPIYLIEEFGSRQNLGLPEANLMQAVANTLLIEGFQCHWTRNSAESISFLTQMTRLCARLYQDKTVSMRSPSAKTNRDNMTHLLSLKDFNAASVKQKPLSVTNMFAKQLMQLSGLSVEKAEAIVKIYPSPARLMAAYREADGDPANLLSKIEYGKNRRTIGPTISQTLAKLYTLNRFDV